MERYYLKDIHRLPDPKEEPAALKALFRERREKCLRYVQADDRRRCLAAGQMLQQMLQEADLWQGSDTEDPVRKGPVGKPLIEGMEFNLSHGGDYVFGVTANRPVGCDIEKMTEPPYEVSEMCFSSEEIAYLQGQVDAREAFWRLWTLKESYVKMTGEGMSAPLMEIEVRLGQTIRVYRKGQQQDCVLYSGTYHGHAVAVCLAGGHPL